MKLASTREGEQALLLQDLQSDPFRCGRFGCRAKCCSADLVGGPIEAKLKPLISRVKTLAVNDGKEFSDHQAVDQTLGIQTCLADLYCSWQRGSNENFNGLVRQYIPNKQRMEAVTDEKLTMI